MNIKTFDSRPIALPIKKIVRENDTVNTYVFDYYLGSQPGQFVMMWIPGVDEKPFSIAFDDGNEYWITVCNVGRATEELFKLKEGDKVGIRGPFGTSYNIEKGDHLALVCGGYGAAPMYNVAHEAVKKDCKVEFLVVTKVCCFIPRRLWGWGRLLIYMFQLMMDLLDLRVM